MSKADEIFINMCKQVLESGYDTKGEKVRPKWPDGTSAYTIKKFGVVNSYDLGEEFPAITLRKTYIKSAIDEILWIWQKKSNNIHDLKSHIWDQWAGQQPTTQANALKWGLAKALLISLSSTRTTLRQNRQVRQDASQVLTSTDII